MSEILSPVARAMLPAVGWSSPVTRRKRVVFPAPFRPMMPHRSPLPEIRVPAGATIHQRLRAELLGEAPELTRRCGAFLEIDEMDLDPPLGEEPQCLAGLGTLSDAEDLDF